MVICPGRDSRSKECATDCSHRISHERTGICNTLCKDQKDTKCISVPKIVRRKRWLWIEGQAAIG